MHNSSGSGGAEGAMPPPGPVKIGHKKMATEGGRIDFMFLAPPAAGSATAQFILLFTFTIHLRSSVYFYVIHGSCTAEVEFEFPTWAWVQATAKTAFCGGLVVWSPGSVKALNQSTHNSLGHLRNVHLEVPCFPAFLTGELETHQMIFEILPSGYKLFNLLHRKAPY